MIVVREKLGSENKRKQLRMVRLLSKNETTNKS
jgi:hypothetical protein